MLTHRAARQRGHGAQKVTTMNWLTQLFSETFQSFFKSMWEGAFNSFFSLMFFWFPGV